MEMKIFDNTFKALEKKLDLTFKRHAVMASNVANAETPGYKAREVDFAGVLKNTLGKNTSPMAKTHNSHMEVGQSKSEFITYDNVGAVGPDGNNVDLDITMGKISRNSAAYTGTINLIQMKLRLLRMATRGRGM